MIAKDNLQSGCTTYGPLVFSSNSSGEYADTNNTFGLESDDENSQLGASLTFNFVGGFYACGSSQDVRVIFLSILPLVLIIFFEFGIKWMQETV